LPTQLKLFRTDQQIGVSKSESMREDDREVKRLLGVLHIQFMSLRAGSSRFLEFPPHLYFLSGDRRPRYRMQLDFASPKAIQIFIGTLKKGLL